MILFFIGFLQMKKKRKKKDNKTNPENKQKDPTMKAQWVQKLTSRQKKKKKTTYHINMPRIGRVFPHSA